MANDRLATVKDEAGVSQGLILDHANGQRVAMTGSAVTSAGLGSPLGWVKNLGPGTIYVRGDGTAAGINQAGSYVLYAGQDWALAADNGARTLSLAGPLGTIVSLIPAKATSAAGGGGGVGGAGFTDADIDAMLPPRPGVPDVGRLRPILKKIRAGLDATFGTVPWGAVTGSIAAQADLVAALAAKSDVGHAHSRTGGTLTGFGSAAGLNVPAAGPAASNEVVKGDDARLSDARAPTAHSQAVSTITGLQTALDNLRVGAGSFTYVIENPAVGTYIVEEYAEAAGTLTHLTDRWTGTSIGYRVQVAGSDVPGLGTSASPLGPTSVQARRPATSGGGFALTQRTTLIVSAVTGTGQLIVHFRRTLA